MSDRDNDSRQGKVRAVNRAFALLERLSISLRGLRLCELARSERLPAATCLRLLTTMQERGFVRFDARTGCWTVGATALYVGANFAATRQIVMAAEPVARHLSTNRRVTVNLGALDGDTVTFLYRVTPGNLANAPPHERTSIPVHCSAIGKAVLSGLPPIEAHAVLGNGRLARVTRNSLVERNLLFDHVEKAHRSQYAIDDEENTNGLRCVAAPIFNEYHRPVAAISIAAPVEQLGSDQLVMLGHELVSAADRIMLSFGGRRPSM
jgi:IclR family acetate operon transcriptional repressor